MATLMTSCTLVGTAAKKETGRLDNIMKLKSSRTFQAALDLFDTCSGGVAETGNEWTSDLAVGFWTMKC